MAKRRSRMQRKLVIGSPDANGKIILAIEGRTEAPRIRFVDKNDNDRLVIEIDSKGQAAIRFQSSAGTPQIELTATMEGPGSFTMFYPTSAPAIRFSVEEGAAGIRPFRRDGSPMTLGECVKIVSVENE